MHALFRALIPESAREEVFLEGTESTVRAVASRSDAAGLRRASSRLHGGEGDACRDAMPIAPPEAEAITSFPSPASIFERDWQRSFWGRNYERLLAAKRRYDPDGLFFVHHGVGSEEWSADGFTRVASS